ncbi:MAG: hypothetical protein AAF492_28325, partial [Verrucomicrobiota bacterium]
LDARLLVRFTASPTQLREFHVNLSGVNNDMDGDLYDDREEFALIDANPLDAVDGLEDVTPEGDFDGDGLSNYAESWLGLDGADPLSVLKIHSIDVDTDSAFWFNSSFGIPYRIECTTNLNGGAWQDIGEATGDGRLLRVPIAPPADKGYYRLRFDLPPLGP